MNNLAIYGAGGLGREALVLLQQVNAQQPRWHVLGFFDDGKSKGDWIEGLPVLGGLHDVNAWKDTLALCVAIGEPLMRNKIVGNITNPLIHFPTLIHPACNAGISNVIGQGSVLCSGVQLTLKITIGEFVWVNLNATVGHDVRIGNFTSLMPAVNLSGNVAIGDECYLGVGASVLQNLVIGERSVIGAGAVVTRSFPALSKLVGVPAKPVTA